MEGESREQQILNVAATLFASRGFHGTSMSDIASEVGMLKGSLYYYVKGKRELAMKIAGTYLQESVAMAEEIAVSEASSVQKLRDIVRFHVTNLTTNYPGIFFAIDERLDFMRDASSSLATQARDEYEKIFRGIVEEGVERGELRRVTDVAMTVRGLLGMCNWMCKWYKPDGDWPSSRIADAFADIAVEALKNRATRESTELDSKAGGMGHEPTP